MDTPWEDFSNSPLDPGFGRVLSPRERKFISAQGHSLTLPGNQAQLVANSRVIAVLLLLLGSRLCGPDGVQAQDSGGRASASPAREAAPPAGSGHRRPYVFFPRAAVETPPVEPFSAAERGNESQIDRVDIAPSTDLGVQAWGASESFSRSRMPQTIPVQYPLDNSVYEGETPLGEDPAKTPPEGSWRDSSVDRPHAELPVEDQPWVEWYKFTMQAQTLPGGGDKGFGMTSIDMKGTLKFARWPFLFVTPRAGFHFLNGPSTTDVPARLYDFSLDTTVYLPLNDRWTITGSAAPSLYSDLQALQNSFRMVGRGLVFYRWSPELQLAGGFDVAP